MNKLIFIFIFCIFNFIGSAQLCLDISGVDYITSAEILSNGNQKITLGLIIDVDNPNQLPANFTINGVNCSVTSPNPAIGTLIGNETLITYDLDIELAPSFDFARFNITLDNSVINTCPFNFQVSIPKTPVCLEILNGQEINCIVDNDGIEIDGDIHVYQMQVYNNDTGPFEFSLAGTQDLSVSFHAPEYILPGETKIVTYEIRSNSGVPASGELSFIFENQNYSSGCEGPSSITFQPCAQSVCLEFGTLEHDGCTTDQNGNIVHSYNAQVINQSNIPLQYSIISTVGGSFPVGGTSRTIAANTTENIAFDYLTPASNPTTNSFYVETETTGVINDCEEVIAVSLPNCSNNSLGSMSLLAFYDQNNNGLHDLNENGLSGIEFRVTNMGTGVLQTVITNALGQADVVDLEPGLYLINQQVNLPWDVTSPPGGALNNVLVSAGGSTSLDFANYHPNAGIALLKLHNVEAICNSQLATGENMYKVSGQLSTSFFEESMLNAIDFNGGSISNFAIGMVPSLASYVPFSFDLITTSVDSVDLEFRLTTSLTQARDTIRLQLQPCCVIGGGFTDTLANCEAVSINYGAFVLPNQNIRIMEVNVTNFQPCTQMIKFESNNANIIVNGIYVIDGDTIFGGNDNFTIPLGTQKLTFYLDGTSGAGQITISSLGCQDTCAQTFTVGQNFNTNATMTISQVTPTFSNIYGASFSLDDLGTTVRPKYVCLGFDNNQNNTQILGVTSANYYYFGGRDGLLPLEKVDNTNSQVRFSIPDFTPYDQRQFNILYTATRKDIPISFAIYAQDGTLLGNGNFTLDGDKVVSKIDDLDNSEDEIIVYPNPAVDYINVSFNNDLDVIGATYSIIDTQGKTAGFGTLNQADQKINIAHLPNGPYILNVVSVDGRTSQHTFLKIK